MSDLPPLANDPGARTADGTLKDANSTIPATTTSTPTPGDQTTHDPAATTDAPATKDPISGPPESYTFKASEGQAFDETLVAAATPVFKELGLTQAQADKLVDVWNKSIVPSEVARNAKIIKAQGDAWTAATTADPDLGPKLDEHKITISRALDQAMTPKEKSAFLAFGDQTLMFNNPDVFRGLLKLATKIAPGTHVTGAGPAPTGQSPTGNTQRPSIANAMYGHLSKAS